MTEKVNRIAFGPVPSRRLGKSIGINNIPPKICTYSCIYCQLGKTSDMQIERKEFYKPQEIFDSVKSKIIEAKKREEPIDYLTFVPDGEPTLDINLGKEIKLLKPLGIKIAVITNSSLMWKKDVRNDLLTSELVSIKIDAISRNIWQKINRPYKVLNLNKILYGITEFSNSFKGDLVTETMLIKDINDSDSELEKLSSFISHLKIKKSYISIPTRPTTEKWANSASENQINVAYQIFKEKNIDVEYLIGYEGNAFAYTGNVVEDLLSITSVHPMKEEAVSQFLKKADKNWDIINQLIQEDKLLEVEYNNKKFYVRKFK